MRTDQGLLAGVLLLGTLAVVMGATDREGDGIIAALLALVLVQTGRTSP